MELGGPLSLETLGSLPTLPKVKAGTAENYYVVRHFDTNCNKNVLCVYFTAVFHISNT